MTATVIPSHDEMVGRILAVRSRATDEQVMQGRRWYGSAGRIVDEIAFATSTRRERVAYALAALSPRNPWLWNIADAYVYALAARGGQPRPSATTFKRNQEQAWAALHSDAEPWIGTAPKVRAFVAAILGDRYSVVVDTWAFRVATGMNDAKTSLVQRNYEALANAYKRAAALTGEDPRDVQAITWIVAQTEGLVSNRRGRHDLTFKAGTPEFVKGLVAE